MVFKSGKSLRISSKNPLGIVCLFTLVAGFVYYVLTFPYPLSSTAASPKERTSTGRYFTYLAVLSVWWSLVPVGWSTDGPQYN